VGQGGAFVAEFSYRITQHGSDIILAISDHVLIGKKFEENDLQLAVSKEFYCGQVCGASKIRELIRSATIINAVGKNIISLLLEEKLIESKNIIMIQGVPHAQIVHV
jgi:hypothetical protein